MSSIDRWFNQFCFEWCLFFTKIKIKSFGEVRSLRSLRRTKHKRKSKDPPLILPEGYAVCTQRDQCPHAGKLIKLKKLRLFYPKKQDNPIFMPLLESEQRSIKSANPLNYMKVKLYREHETHARQDFVDKWQLTSG